MKRIILITCIALLSFVCLAAEQCKGTTQAGERCKKRTSDPSVYCDVHRKTESSVKAKETTKETSTAKATAGQCTATTQKGARCKRSAAAGSDKCWQHK